MCVCVNGVRRNACKCLRQLITNTRNIEALVHASPVPVPAAALVRTILFLLWCVLSAPLLLPYEQRRLSSSNVVPLAQLGKDLLSAHLIRLTTLVLDIASLRSLYLTT